MRLRPALLLTYLIPGLLFASDLDDPLPVRDPFPFKLLFLDQAPAGAGILPARQAWFALDASYVNTLVATDDLVRIYEQNGEAYNGQVTLGMLQAVADAQPSHSAFILDAETLRTTLRARLGIGRRFEVGADMPFLSQGRGFMDRIIDSFHERFHLSDGGRAGFAHNQYRAGYIGDGETFYLDRAPSGLRLGDIVLSATRTLLVGRERYPAISLTLSAKLPSGDYRTLYGSGSLDYGAALRGSKEFGRSTAHAGYAYNVVGEWRAVPDLPLRNSRSLYAAYVVSATQNTSIVVQAVRTSGPFPFRAGNDLAKVAMEIVAGFRHRLPRGFQIEWSFIENLDPFYNAPDIGTYLGLTYRPGPAPAAAGLSSLHQPNH